MCVLKQYAHAYLHALILKKTCRAAKRHENYFRGKKLRHLFSKLLYMIVSLRYAFSMVGQIYNLCSFRAVNLRNFPLSVVIITVVPTEFVPCVKTIGFSLLMSFIYWFSPRRDVHKLPMPPMFQGDVSGVLGIVFN